MCGYRILYMDERIVFTMEIERRANETQLEYHKRLIYGKLVDKTLSDMDYSELAERVYGKSYSSDVARRMMYGSCKTLELFDTERTTNASQDEIVTELNEKILELQRERKRYFDQRREFNKLVSKDAREEHLYEQLATAAFCLSESVGTLYTDHSSAVEYLSDNEAILVYSDWHYGLKASNVFNKYDTNICKDRVIGVTLSSADRIRLHSCSKLHVVVLGDLIHGAVHNSARVASEELVCEQIMRASEILAQSIEYLSQYVGETLVYITYGNHARTVQNKNDSIHRDNMERLIPWWLEQRFINNESISVIQDSVSEFLFINACGHEFCASHGDNDSVRNSPRLLTTLFQKQYGKDIEYILLGDKHHRESFDELGVCAMLCGSLCGTDDYANSKRLYSTPSQLLLIVNPKCGVDAEYRLSCK